MGAEWLVKLILRVRFLWASALDHQRSDLDVYDPPLSPDAMHFPTPMGVLKSKGKSAVILTRRMEVYIP